MGKRLTQFEHDHKLWKNRSTMSLQIWHAQLSATVLQLRHDAKREVPSVATNLRASAFDLRILQKRINDVIASRGGADHIGPLHPKKTR